MIILILSVAIISYGTWLNQQGEFQIAKSIAERTLQLQGSKASLRTLHPKIVLDTINLTSDAMADAVALIDGRITETFVEKNSYVNRGDVIFSVVNENIPLQIKESESGIMKARAALRQAENDYQRYTRLREKDAASVQQYDAALAQYEAAKASLDEMETRKAQLLIQSARQNVTAPVDGKESFVSSARRVCISRNCTCISRQFPLPLFLHAGRRSDSRADEYKSDGGINF